MRMTISVTEGDIAKGERENCVACPIALACRREVGLLDIEVTEEDVIIAGGWARLPRVAREFVAKFDAGEPVQPFTFEVTDEEGP